jgi:FAD/FMN-containing dehydrogenase
MTLRETVGDDGWLDPERFSLAGVVPQMAVAPATDEEAVSIVEAIQRDRLHCIVVGAGTRVSIGGPPAQCDVAISTSRLTGTVRYDPADLTGCFRAGTPLQDIQNVLAQNNQWLPFEPEFGGPATFGGAIATNCSGAAQDGLGLPRDRVLQLTAVTGYGKRIQVGAPVVKNVAGYDIHRLFCGSWGTLGLILDATVRVEPELPRTTLVRELSNWDEAAQLDADRQMGSLVSFVIRWEGRLSVEYDLTGHQSMMDYCKEFTGQPRRTACETSLIRFAMPVGRAIPFARRLSDADPQAMLVIRPLSGIVWHIDGDAATAISVATENCYGWRIERGGGGAPWAAPRTGFKLMQQIKNVFDPDGLFNAGRFVGGL